MITGIRHTGIVTDDLDESLRFYCDELGFTMHKRMEEGGDYIAKLLGVSGPITTAKLAAPDGALIELVYYHDQRDEKAARPIHSIGISHIAVGVQDLDGLYQRLVATGVTFISPPCRSPDGYASVAFCRAPEGTFIEMVQILAG